MKKLNVELGVNSYPIYICSNFEGFEEALESIGRYGSIYIISDSNTQRLVLPDLLTALEKISSRIYTMTFPAGEENKNFTTLNSIYEFLLSSSIDRRSLVIALGGGVTGDMAGFAAATILRGVDLVQIPTTLLSQADSSVGGKTGIDFSGYKNMIGAFKQPKMVYINVGTLKTLEERQMRSGLMETIKHALIKDADFFKYLDDNMEKIFNKDMDILKYIAQINCLIKADVVARDEKESGLREILNFGHTIGHAVESASSFTLTHGESVALGTAAVLDISNKLGYTTVETVVTITELISRAGLPISLIDACPGIDREKIFENLFLDKKVRDSRIRLIVLNDIGSVQGIYLKDTDLIREVINNL